jgi:hypothetical protein
MAEYPLIDAYLATMDRQLSHRRDALELREEIADHLLESVARFTSLGLDPHHAQRSTLDRFGEPHIVAALLSTVPTKGIDMINALGRAIGVLSILTALSWVAAMVTFPIGFSDALIPTTDSGAAIASATAAAAALLTSLTLVALNIRTAGRVDALTSIVIVTGVLASTVAGAMPWAVPIWLLVLAVGLAVTFARDTRSPLGRGWVSVALLIVAPLGILLGGLALVVYNGSGMFITRTSQALAREATAQLITFEVLAALLASGFAVIAVRALASRSLAQPPEAFVPA